jgi:hypothetical protein
MVPVERYGIACCLERTNPDDENGRSKRQEPCKKNKDMEVCNLLIVLLTEMLWGGRGPRFSPFLLGIARRLELGFGHRAQRELNEEDDHKSHLEWDDSRHK